MKKIILQHDQRDCGAACLAMITAYYGLKYPISKYRELVKTSKTGTNLYGLVDGGKQLGFNSEAVSGTPEDLIQGIKCGEIILPFIAHTVNEKGFLHYIVVFSWNNKFVVVGDPARGKCKLSTEDFFALWTGYIVIFEKTESFQPGNYNKGSFLRFLSLLQGEYKKLVAVLIISLVISIIGIVGSFIFQVVLDDFVLKNNSAESIAIEFDEDADNHTESEENSISFDSIMHMATDWISGHSDGFHSMFIAVICLYLLQAVIQIARGYLIVQVSRSLDIRLSLSYYRHILGLPVSAVSVRQTGEYLSRFSDASVIRNAISSAALTLILDSMMVVACGIILYAENATMFFVALLMVVFYAIVVLAYHKPIELANRNIMECNAVVQSYLKESIDGVETVKAACATEEVNSVGTSRFQAFLNAVVKGSMISVTQDVIASTVEAIGTLVILWIGFSLALSGKISVGSLITFYVLLSYFTVPIKNLIGLQPTIQTALVAADRLNDILDMEQEEECNSTEEIDLPPVSVWSFEHVDFRYGNYELVLKDISFQVNQGQKIAIVGESGSGKTTLAKLLIRFYIPEKGHILLDNHDILETDLTALRRGIAYVSQDTFLFSDTIRNNLKLGSPNISDEEILQACKISRANEFIESMPMGYDTPLDENGINLSGGQRQRLALARALLKKPQLLILDEATSNLDTITEAAIRDTIFKLDKSLTCIIIAHRLTTVKNCDQIYVMDHGQILEHGTHEDLMVRDGKYSQLWHMQ